MNSKCDDAIIVHLNRCIDTDVTRKNLSSTFPLHLFLKTTPTQTTSRTASLRPPPCAPRGAMAVPLSVLRWIHISPRPIWTKNWRRTPRMPKIFCGSKHCATGGSLSLQFPECCTSNASAKMKNFQRVDACASLNPLPPETVMLIRLSPLQKIGKALALASCRRPLLHRWCPRCPICLLCPEPLLPAILSIIFRFP